MNGHEAQEAFDLLIHGDIYEGGWDAIQAVQYFLDGKKDDLEGAHEGGRLFPTTGDLTTEELAEKIQEYSNELVTRDKEKLERDLAAARKVWPSIRAALYDAGKNLPASEPSISPGNPSIIGTFLNNNGAAWDVRRKSEALENANKYGHSGWWTVPDYIMWLHDGGPIIEAAMKSYGYQAPKRKE